LKKFAVFLVIASALLAWLLVAPFRGFQGDVYAEFPRGTGTAGIARELAREGVIRYPWQFWMVRLTRPSAKLQAGEYRFARAASVLEVFDRIARGDIYYFEFTVPEGSNIFDIAHALEAQSVMPAEAFLMAADDPSPISDLAPSAKSLEGYLFPSTYRLSHVTTAMQLCRMMTAEFRKQWTKLARGRADGTAPADPQRIVTLASLVEKETGAADERPLVASVFTNRLAKNMRLDCDPTTIYAALLDQRYRGAIHRSDLASTNPYNTYQNAGLPPGPIANPGVPALMAALAPAETKYLYFVAKPEGGAHQFSESIAQHEKAVIAYRHATQGKSR
jgi:UPF0755 protein